MSHDLRFVRVIAAPPEEVFAAFTDDDVGPGLGSGGERLHDWLGDGGEGSLASGRRGRAVRSSTS